MTNLMTQIKQLDSAIKSECTVENVLIASLYESHSLSVKMKQLLIEAHGDKLVDFTNVRDTMVAIENEAWMVTHDSMFNLLLSAK